MQILGKRSKILLMGLLALMLITLGASFAVWDGQAALAATGNAASYANAKVGDVIQFGRYWQKAGATYNQKDPIQWIVVDKDERNGQLTLMSKYIIAYGGYFGDWYFNNAGGVTKVTQDILDNIPVNQAWSESTARAFLNNLERFDLGGDNFTDSEGLSSTRTPNKTTDGKLKGSTGFSNAKFWTGLTTDSQAAKKLLLDSSTGIIKRGDNKELYYKRPKVTDSSQRLARNGFLDEAFTAEEREMIVPYDIPGVISYRWPASSHFADTAEYVPGTRDKVWIPTAENLNVLAGVNWDNTTNNSWSNSSATADSKPFEYFKNYTKYTKQTTLANAIKTTHTAFAGQAGSLGNFSIPWWSTNAGNNRSSAYWTRSAGSAWCSIIYYVKDTGIFDVTFTCYSHIGVRPCIILQY